MMEKSTFKNLLKKNCRAWIVILAVILLTALSCGKGNQSSTSGTALDTRSTLTVDGVSLRVFDESGVPIGNPAEQYSLALAPEADGRSVIVATKTKLNSTACYLELRFNAAKEHPANIQAGSAMQEYNPLVYTGSPEAGVVIAAQVIPGAKADRFSGELLKLKLLPGKHNLRHSSGFEQDPVSDPILAETSVDPTNPNKFYWTLKLRGDGNANQIFDFADFGVIGAKYNKSANDPGCEVADANNKGKVDFADFGIVGANYNKGIGALKIWRDDNTEPTKLHGTLSFTSKLKGDFTHNPVDSQIQTSGFKHFWHTSSSSGQNYKIALLDLSGSEIPGNSTKILNTGSNGGSGDWWMFGRDAKHSRCSTLLGPLNWHENWIKSVEGAVYSSPAISKDGSVYVGCNDKKIYAFNANGSLKWSYQTDSSIETSSPAINAEGTIYIGSGKKLYALFPNGTLKWSFTTGDVILSSPAIGVDGTIYFSSSDTNIYALKPNGDEKWKVNTGASVKSSPAIGDDGTVYVGSSDGKLYAITQEGKTKWTYQTSAPILSSPTIGPNNIIYIGSWDNYFYAINSEGDPQWNIQTEDKIETSPAIGSDSTIYIAGNDKSFYSLSESGNTNWKKTLSSYVTSSPTIDAAGNVIIGLMSGEVQAYNSKGEILWSYQAKGSVRSSIAIGNDKTIYFGSEGNKFYSLRFSGYEPGTNPPTNLQLKLEGNLVIATWKDPDKNEEWYVSWNGQPTKATSMTYSEYSLLIPDHDGFLTVTCEVKDKVGLLPITSSIELIQNEPIGSNVIGMRLVPLTEDGKLRVGEFLLVEFYVSAPAVGIGQFNVISLGTTAGAFVPAAKTDTAFGTKIVTNLIGARSSQEPNWAGGFSTIDPATLVGGDDLTIPGIWAGMGARLENLIRVVWKTGITPSIANVDAVDCFVATDNAGAGAVGKFPAAKMDIFREMGVIALGITSTTSKSGWICSVVLKAIKAGDVTLGIIVDDELTYTYYNDLNGNDIYIKPTKFVKLNVLNVSKSASWIENSINKVLQLSNSSSSVFDLPATRMLSAYNQTAPDTIVQDATYDSGTKTVKWTNVFRADCDTKGIVDYADLGVIGAQYSKEVKTTAYTEAADADGNGKVDFTDFGRVGAWYNQRTGSWSFWYSNTPFINPPTNPPMDTIETGSTSTGKRGFREINVSTDELPSYSSEEYIYIAPNDGTNVYPALGASISTK